MTTLSVSEKFLRDISLKCLEALVSDGSGRMLPLNDSLAKLLKMARDTSAAGKKIIFIGNGGSAAIANHQATDYWKNGHLKTLSFSDSSLLTCVSNDFGYQYSFSKPIETYGDRGDLLVAISSSGQSPNILEAVRVSNEKGINVVTFSGFKESNPLRKEGMLNFYVNSLSYGIVEVAHLTLIHSVLEEHIETRKE